MSITFDLGEWWLKSQSFMWDKLKSHLHIWSFLLAVVACGLIFGGIVAGITSPHDKMVITGALSNLLSTMHQGHLVSPHTLWIERMMSDGRLLAIIWILGLSIIGLPLIPVVIFLRSFSVGFSIGFTVLAFGWRGVWFSATGIFPHQLVSFVALALAGGLAIRFSAHILRQSVPLQRLLQNVIVYTGVFCLLVIPLAVGAAMQAFWSPMLISSILSHATGGAFVA